MSNPKNYWVPPATLGELEVRLDEAQKMRIKLIAAKRLDLAAPFNREHRRLVAYFNRRWPPQDGT